MPVDVLDGLLVLVVAAEVLDDVVEVLLRGQVHDPLVLDALVVADQLPGVVGRHLVDEAEADLLVRVVLEQVAPLDDLVLLSHSGTPARG